MIWKISDELKLTSKDEKKFSEIFKKLNQKKNELNRSMQETISKAEAQSEKAISQSLQSYRKQLSDYNKLSEQEFDELKKIFGSTKMIQYLRIKQDLNARLKSILSQGEAGTKSPSQLPQPRIIEEK